MLRAGVGGPRSGEASGGPGALQAATLPPPRHSSAGGSSKQQPLAREHTAAHLCCGGNKAATPRPGLPLEGLGQEGRTGAAETVPNAVSEGQPRGGQHPSLAPEFRSAGAAPRSAQCSVGARDRRAPSWCPSVSSPGSTTPAFLDERPRKLVLSSSREHDLRRSATQRSPLCLKRDLREDSISAPSAVDHRSWKSALGNRNERSAADVAGSERSASQAETGSPRRSRPRSLHLDPGLLPCSGVPVCSVP